MNKRNFIPAFAVMAAILLTACAGKVQEEAETETSAPLTEAEPARTEDVSGEIPENSILYFNGDEGSAKLVEFFEEGKIPEEATILYDQMGANPHITITEPEKIQELYNLLSMVTVTGETQESITDCYHSVEFKLSDDCYIHYSFEGSGILSCEKQNYSIENSKKLFAFMSTLTDEYWDLQENK